MLDLVGGQIGAEQDNSDNWNQVREVTKNISQFGGETAVKLEVDSARSQKQLDEVRGLINSYITHLLGFPPRLHKFLKNI